MMRSLWSGVSGLQAHQIAMDVEGNNIANVNTTGFKYSRANFADLLSQTAKIATAPQGNLGGKNAMQIGLGTTIQNVSHIFSQGSVQTTDKNTDVAIQGDGFFIVSGDGGNTYKYTRSGDFKFDANGNFVDNNGYIIQGWLRDEQTKSIDTTRPITSINIPSGLTTPAEDTSNIAIKANLNAGNTIRTKAPSDTSIRYSDDLNNIYTADGIRFRFDKTVPDSVTVNGTTFEYGRDFSTIDELVTQINSIAGVSGVYLNGNGQIVDPNDNIDSATSTETTFATVINKLATNQASDPMKRVRYGFLGSDDVGELFDGSGEAFNLLEGSGVTLNINGTDHNLIYTKTGVDATHFNNMQDLINSIRTAFANDGLNVTVDITDEGKIKITNNDATAFSLSVSGYPNDENDNNLFTQTFASLVGTYTGVGSSKYTQQFNAAVHTASIDIFDSLGSKHTLTLHYRKQHTATSANDVTTWQWYAEMPEPGELQDPTYGTVSFESGGALFAYTPTTLQFNPNNGAANDQTINLDFGTIGGGFDGITSFDAPSSTAGISQDGYPGGDLVGIRIDQSGTLIGSFSNGRSFGLAQIAMAKFTNNEGLVSDGGNVFLQSANSGDPVIGSAQTGGRGLIQAAALEMSNVDLSRSLTQLIVVQRGFQANSKTITTSDQMLQTLLQLKQ
ncbi:flagellar hook-basal body complex protein [Hydrogenimonas sp.]